MHAFTIHMINSESEPWDDEYEDQDEDLLPLDHAFQASIVASKAGIGITRDRDLTAIALNADGKVVGAAWTATSHDSYEFDVAVLPEFQGQGVGRKLLDVVIKPPFDYEDQELDLTQRVVSPIMYKALVARGFNVVEARVFDIHRQEVDLDMRPYDTLKDVLQQLYTHDPDAYTEAVTQHSSLAQGTKSFENIMQHHQKPSQLAVTDQVWLKAMMATYCKTCREQQSATTKAAIQSLEMISNGHTIEFKSARDVTQNAVYQETPKNSVVQRLHR